MFSQHLSETRKNQACQNQGSVFNIIVTAVKTVNITWNQREKRRTSLGQVWGEETDPALLSTVPGGYRNVTLRVQPAETWYPKQGSCDPRCWVWGRCGPHPICMGQEPVPGDPTSALYFQRVSSPLRFPTSELRLLPWLTHGPFSSLFLSLSFEVRTFE